MKKKYKCDVDCANCAAKMEDAVKKIDGVKSVQINFMTQKLILEADEDRFEEVLEKSIKEMKKVDSDVEVYK